jgi:hypothetical protein
MRRAWMACAPWIFYAACGRATIGLPPLGDAKSVVVLLESGSPIVEAHDLLAPNRRISIDNADTVTALLYPRDLAALALDEGRVRLYNQPGGRALPRPSSTFRRNKSDDRWREARPEDSALFATFRIPPETTAQCTMNGGCYSDPDQDCVEPCPDPLKPMPPQLPDSVLPGLTPCPDGWSEVQGTLIAECDPRPEKTCGIGLFSFLGQACTAIGPACPSDGWPLVQEGANVVWVDAAAAGHGTKADPFGTIGAALRMAPSGSTIAVRRGRYSESPAVDGGRKIIGGCVAEVVIAGDVSVGIGALSALTVMGAVKVSGMLEVDTARIDGTETAIDLASGARLEATRIVAIGGQIALNAAAGANVGVGGSILDSATAASLFSATASVSDSWLTGLLRVSGGQLVLDRVELSRTATSALAATGGADVSGTRVVIRGTGVGPAVLASPATFTLTQSDIEVDGDAFDFEGGRPATLEQVHILHTGAPRLDGIGVNGHGGMVVARRVLVEGVYRAFSVDRTNLLVTASTIDGGARGVFAGDGAELRVDTSMIRGTTDWAVRIEGVVDRPGDTYQLSDLVLRDVHGVGIESARSQIGRITRIEVAGASGPVLETGLFASTPVIYAKDIIVSKVACGGCGAISLLAGLVQLDRFELDDLDGSGVSIAETASAKLSNGHIARAHVGLAVSPPLRDPHDLFSSVTFEEVADVCAPCGE